MKKFGECGEMVARATLMEMFGGNFAFSSGLLILCGTVRFKVAFSPRCRQTDCCSARLNLLLICLGCYMRQNELQE